MLYTPILLLFLIKQGNSLTGKDSTALYGSSGSVSCSDDDGSITWSQDGTQITDDSEDYSISVTGSTSTLNVISVTNDASYTCASSGSTAEVSIRCAAIAGVSSPLCKGRCTVSCTLSNLQSGNLPTSVLWKIAPNLTVSNGSLVNVETDAGNYSIQHRSPSLLYSSQETFLDITDLVETSYFTCSFTLQDDNQIDYIVSALIRDTEECDVVRCVSAELCRSNEINSNATCSSECRKCFSYTYQIGDFRDLNGENRECHKDASWCEEYLDDRDKCGNHGDKIAKYCELCGYCMDLEFTPSKIILPAVILVALCMLTALMCYKAYDEKRSILPKVKSKSFPSKEMTKPSSPTI